MIYEIQKELAAHLKTREVPFPVIYGPEKTEQTANGRTRIVVQRDDDGGDVFAPPTSLKRGAKSVLNVQEGARILIYAQATIQGAMLQDHQRLATMVRDFVVPALDQLIRGGRKSAWRIVSAKFLSAQQLETPDVEQWSGVVYEIRFSADRSVNDYRTWVGAELAAGDPAPSGTPQQTLEDLGGSVANVTKANQNGSVSVETGCGE